MKKLISKVVVFSTCIAMPFVLYADSGGRKIPSELLEISCDNTQCTPETFSSIESSYSHDRSCDTKFAIGPRLRIALYNIINSHYRDYHFSRREFCKTGMLPERKNSKHKSLQQSFPTKEISNEILQSPLVTEKLNTISPNIKYVTSYKRNGLSMRAPKGWIFISPAEMRKRTKGKLGIAENTIFFAVNKSDYDSNINVQYVGDASREAPNNVSASKFLKQMQRQIVPAMSKSLPGFKKIKSEIIDFANGVAIDFEFTSLRDSTMMKQKQLIVISGMKAFTITCTAKEGSFDEYFSAGFEPILKSVEIL